MSGAAQELKRDAGEHGLEASGSADASEDYPALGRGSTRAQPSRSAWRTTAREAELAAKVADLSAQLHEAMKQNEAKDKEIRDLKNTIEGNEMAAMRQQREHDVKAASQQRLADRSDLDRRFEHMQREFARQLVEMTVLGQTRMRCPKASDPFGLLQQGA